MLADLSTYDGFKMICGLNLRGKRVWMKVGMFCGNEGVDESSF